MIRDDRIDILVDLAGHSSDNRLLVLARRPAAVQMSYLGYPNTTGLQSCDHVITDVDLDPEGTTEEFHTERLLRLPRTMHCYRPPADAPHVQSKSLESGAVQFGSFNRIDKLTPATLELWLPLLRAVPDAHLTLRSPGLADEDTRAELLKRFAEGGIDAGRLTMLPRDLTLDEHFLARYHTIDLAIDSFPYNGTTTTCEALWMGVPVLTMCGKTRVTRTTAGILRAIGLDELIASTPQQFTEIGTALAADRKKLRDLRAGMRDRMKASALMDPVSLTQLIEQGYRDAWRGWCASGRP
jgi:predicted O-linked N-acetylglucosamine transferase (SPINDLY family)